MKLRSFDPTLLYCIDSDWTTLSIGGIKLVSLGILKFDLFEDSCLHSGAGKFIPLGVRPRIKV